MRVELVSCPDNPERQIACAARLCYSATNACDISDKMTEEEEQKVLNIILANGHDSPLEHASFTFAVDGVSRALTHQLVRHRLASYNQQSQRYVAFKDGKFPIVIPPSIENNKTALALFNIVIEEIQDKYELLLNVCKIPAEDARYLLPNATETKIFITMNARELKHFFRERCCNRAQWEIRELAWKMLELVRDKAPRIFADAGPECIRTKCPEGTMTCGEPYIK